MVPSCRSSSKGMEPKYLDFENKVYGCTFLLVLERGLLRMGPGVSWGIIEKSTGFEKESLESAF